MMEALEIMFEMVASTPEAMAAAKRVVKAERARLAALQAKEWDFVSFRWPVPRCDVSDD